MTIVIELSQTDVIHHPISRGHDQLHRAPEPHQAAAGARGAGRGGGAGRSQLRPGRGLGWGPKGWGKSPWKVWKSWVGCHFSLFFGAGVVREIVIFGDGLKPARPVYITCYV